MNVAHHFSKPIGSSFHLNCSPIIIYLLKFDCFIYFTAHNILTLVIPSVHCTFAKMSISFRCFFSAPQTKRSICPQKIDNLYISRAMLVDKIKWSIEWTQDTLFFMRCIHDVISIIDMSQSWRECFLINVFTWCCISIENFPLENHHREEFCWFCLLPVLVSIVAKWKSLNEWDEMNQTQSAYITFIAVFSLSLWCAFILYAKCAVIRIKTLKQTKQTNQRREEKKTRRK